jgi:hypothetical protein
MRSRKGTDCCAPQGLALLELGNSPVDFRGEMAKRVDWKKKKPCTAKGQGRSFFREFVKTLFMATENLPCHGHALVQMGTRQDQ